MKTGKKLIAAVLALVLSTMLVFAAPIPAGADENATVANRFNVVLVIDKSGSLCSEDGIGTDPKGLRFDAMKLFLGLLTESGNNVGVICFDEAIRYDSGLRPISSLAEKKELVSAAEALRPSYETDIGAAVLRATELLHGMQEENGLPCAILLLTDGMTDFPAGPDQWQRLTRSWDAGEKALRAAQEEGIAIHGILLNVDGMARSGISELRAYTRGTNGQFKSVSAPEDLTAAFARFYSIINRTEYTGAHRVVFSEQGSAELDFLVPPFGMEEANIVIEHEAGVDDSFDGVDSIRIVQPDGSEYDVAPHMLSTSRFLLVKIPHPAPGKWHAGFTGDPGDSIDVCLIYNASLGVAVSAEDDGEDFRVLRPVRFRAVVTDAEFDIGEQELNSIQATLRVVKASSGAAREIPMALSDGGYGCEVTFEEGGEYSISAQVSLSGFEVSSETLRISVAVPPPAAVHGAVTAITDCGSVRDNLWEVELGALFADPKGTELRYSLSDDLGGALSIENGVLRADLAMLDSASFTVTATDAYGLSAELPFEITVRRPAMKLEGVSDMLTAGSFTGDTWEIDLDTLFEGAEPGSLRYTLSDDLGGAVSIDGSVLRARLAELEDASFTVTATNAEGLSTSLPFSLHVPAPEAIIEGITALAEQGSVHDNVWEVELGALFADAKGGTLSYALSDDFGGALTIENGVLRADLSKLDSASFTVTAEDACGLKAEIPVAFTVDRPEAKLESVSGLLDAGSLSGDTWEIDLDSLFDNAEPGSLTYTLSDELGGAVSIDGSVLRVTGVDNASFTVTATNAEGLSTTLPFALHVPAPEANIEGVTALAEQGSIQDGIWEVELSALFADPKGGALSYTISDDFDGAVTIENGSLRADLSELDSASFTVIATDAFGLKSELPFEITVNRPEAKLESVSDMLAAGSFTGDSWELDLDSLFEGAEPGSLSYTVSDELGGAVSIDGSVLRVTGVDSASFTVTATNVEGLSTALPFSLSVPGPEAASDGVEDTVKTGWFQKGTWDLALAPLFKDPKGGALSYSVSDELGGALSVEDGTLHADCKGIGTADFTVTATDAFGLSAGVGVKLIENSVTWIYILILVLIVLLILAVWYIKKRKK